MESPPMDTVYQAISALYSNPIASEKEKASIWLADVQKSIHSWKIADELLQQKKDVESCYFAAQTMRSKVQHNLSELPAEALVSLRDSLVSHLDVSSPNTNNAIVTQLCLAVADLALQMPSWQNCVSDLVKLFSSKNSYVLLEILTVLPQEIDSSNLKLGENRREDIKAQLRSNSPLVSLFLKESINSSQNSDVALKIVKCMTSWIQVGAINIQEVPENAVICFSLQILRDENAINILHDAAADCICSILHCLENNTDNEPVEKLLFDGVAALEETYHMAVAHEEEEKAVNYARVFTELGETFLEKIIACAADGNPHFAIRSLELALVCVGHHDYEVAEITFNLWYRLSEEVYQRDYQPLTDVFKPHVERLIEALARHCQYEPDLTKLPEEGDEFFEFRMKVMDLIRDVVFMVGSSAVFRQMVSVLRSDAPWERVEAALFIMQAVAKNILPEEYEYVPQVVEAILAMPESAHVAVRKTCILVVGELGEWVQQHPEWLSPALQALLRALPHPLLAPAAAAALKNICAACRSQAAAHAATLLETVRLADQMNLPLNTSSTLMRALAAAIGRLPQDQLELALREATAFQLRGLGALCAGEGGGGGDPVPWLDRLAALFRDVDVLPEVAAAAAAGHPCMPAFRDAWPVIAAVMDKYKQDGRVMERACRTIRFAVRATGPAATELLSEFVNVLPQIYASKQHPCILYLTAVLCDALVPRQAADSPESAATAAAFLHLLHALMPRALDLLNEPDGLRDNPDTVDDLYRLCIRYQQRIPLQFLSSGALGAALRLGARAAALDHREASSSLMRFLHDVLRAARPPRARPAPPAPPAPPAAPPAAQLATNAIAMYGEELTYALLEASVLHLHSYMLSEVAEVLVELVAQQRALARDWLGGALRRLPRARACATDLQCAQFHQYALRTEKWKEMLRLLREFARLYR